MKPNKITHNCDSYFLEGLCVFAKSEINRIKDSVKKEYGEDGINAIKTVYDFAQEIKRNLKESKYVEIIIHYEND